MSDQSIYCVHLYLFASNNLLPNLQSTLAGEHCHIQNTVFCLQSSHHMLAVLCLKSEIVRYREGPIGRLVETMQRSTTASWMASSAQRKFVAFIVSVARYAIIFCF